MKEEAEGESLQAGIHERSLLDVHRNKTGVIVSADGDKSVAPVKTVDCQAKDILVRPPRQFASLALQWMVDLTMRKAAIVVLLALFLTTAFAVLPVILIDQSFPVEFGSDASTKDGWDLIIWRDFGVTRIRWGVNFVHSNNSVDPPHWTTFTPQVRDELGRTTVVEIGAGWPLRIVAGRAELANNPKLDADRQAKYSWAIPLGQDNNNDFVADHTLPLRPIWHGWLGNILIFGLAIVLLDQLARRLIRPHQSATCHACGYKLIPSQSRCSECGLSRK